MNKGLNITESEKKNILGLYGLLHEQSMGALVSNNVYKAISNIESVFSFTNQNGEIKGSSFSGKEKEDNIRNAIQNTIRLDYWFRINEFTRGQIYSFMFQSDSGSTSKLRWLAGLAQSVDSSINRGSIVGKPINDPYVQSAIKLIQQNVENINYQNYVNIVKQQCQAISGTINDDANRKKIWGPRPIALDKLMRGESWESVKNWWYQQIGESGNENPNQQQTTNTKYKPGETYIATNTIDNKQYTIQINKATDRDILAYVNGELKELSISRPGIFVGNSTTGDFINIVKKR